MAVDDLTPLLATPWYCRLRLHRWARWGETYRAGQRAYQRRRCLDCGKIQARRIGLAHDEHEASSRYRERV